ncbi:MAG: DUF1993 domain-containing protein [Hyphomicrobiaceae bacterium]
MTISMYQASVPTFVHTLEALSKILDKAEAFCTAKKVDPTVIVNARLAPDMFALARQVQIACDFAKGASARLAGVDVPAYEDSEKTIADLKARIKKTVDFIKTLSPSQIDGSEERDINLKIAGNAHTFKGQPYLITFAIPNYYFHLTTAYAILRHNGVELSKGDFLGMSFSR